MKPLDDEWEIFRERNLPHDLPEAHLKSYKRIFYTGALAMHVCMRDAVAAEDKEKAKATILDLDRFIKNWQADGHSHVRH